MSASAPSWLWWKDDQDVVSWLWSLRVAVGVVILSFVCLVWMPRIRVRIEAKAPFPDLPMLPHNHFFWGHLRFLFGLDFEGITSVADQTSNEFGLFGLWALGQRTVWTTRWEDARAILFATDSRKVIALVRYHMSMAFGPGNIFLLKGRAWKFHRLAILKSLHQITTGTYQQHAVAGVVSHLIQSLHQKFTEKSAFAADDDITTATAATTWLEMDVEPLMKMMTMDIFGKTALSTDFECCQHLAPSPLASAFDFLGSDMTRRIRAPISIANYWYSLPTRLNRQHEECRTRVRTFLAELIQQRRRRQVETTTTAESDLLSLMIHASDDAKNQSGENEDESMGDQTLIDVLMSLVFAGYDTTSICLTYALYLLANHPVEQEYCWQEAQRLLVSTTTTATNTTTSTIKTSLEQVPLDDLVFCKAVVLEALRLFPPALLVNRSIEKDLPLGGGFVAPAGTNALFYIWTLQRLEYNFPCPNEFRPDRWVQRMQSEGAAADAVWEDRSAENDHVQTDGCTIPPGNSNALLAFSVGSRSCPGQKFAMQEAILALAGLVHQFEFHVVPGYTLQPVRRGLVQGPKGGMPLRITPRGKQGPSKTVSSL